MADGRYVSYLRVSTAQQGRSGLGVEAQRAAVADYLNGGSWRLIEEYKEVESGRRSDRPELLKALAHCRSHGASLVVAKVDRLARSQIFLSKVLGAGVEVRFCDLPQIEGPTGRFLLQSMMSVAELEAGMISARTKAALSASKARGKKLGGRRQRRLAVEAAEAVAAAVAAGIAGTPGETMAAVDGAIAAHDAAEAANEAAMLKARAGRSLAALGHAHDVKQALERADPRRTASLHSIAKKLNADGVRTPRGKGGEWTATTVRRVRRRLGMPTASASVS